jgi:hypothetical protein
LAKKPLRIRSCNDFLTTTLKKPWRNLAHFLLSFP